MEKNYFQELYDLDLSAKIEEKNHLSYLAWAWAWAEVKKRHPDANYTIYENASGWNYHTDGKTCWVKTGVTVEGIEHIEYLPVLDFKNASIPLDKVTSYDVNKAIQRSLTKACARHGVGLYLYAGEDLPEGADEHPTKPKATKKPDAPAPAQAPVADDVPPDVPFPEAVIRCAACGQEVRACRKADGTITLPQDVVAGTGGLCVTCWKSRKAANQ